MERNVFKIMNDVCKKCCLTGEINYSLESLAESCKKTKIKAIGAKYGIKLSDKLTKQQMLEDVIPAISIGMNVKLRQYDESDLKILIDSLRGGEISEEQAEQIINSAPFEDGLVYVFCSKDCFTPCVPSDLAGKILEYCSAHFLNCDLEPLARCAKAAALMYGSFTPEILARLAAEYGLECSADDAEKFLQTADMAEFTYSDGKAVCTYAEFGQLSEHAAGLDYDIPKRKEIDAYAAYGFDSLNYYYRQIISFIYSKCGITYENARLLIKNISLWCMTDGDLPDIFKYIQQSEPKITADQFNFLLDMIGELSYGTRKWNLKGHKACDVQGIKPRRMPQVQEKAPETVHVEPVRATPKVGRNDPCPCGSGKKYKKCCGKSKND